MDEFERTKKEKNWASLASRDLVRLDNNADGKGLEVCPCRSESFFSDLQEKCRSKLRKTAEAGGAASSPEQTPHVLDRFGGKWHH